MEITNNIPEAPIKRKAYTTPRIEDHGALNEVTLGGGGAYYDGSGYGSEPLL
jgi:hypothetical protein